MTPADRGQKFLMLRLTLALESRCRGRPLRANSGAATAVDARPALRPLWLLLEHLPEERTDLALPTDLVHGMPSHATLGASHSSRRLRFQLHPPLIHSGPPSKRTTAHVTIARSWSRMSVVGDVVDSECGSRTRRHLVIAVTTRPHRRQC